MSKSAFITTVACAALAALVATIILKFLGAESSGAIGGGVGGAVGAVVAMAKKKGDS